MEEQDYRELMNSGATDLMHDVSKLLEMVTDDVMWTQDFYYSLVIACAEGFGDKAFLFPLEDTLFYFNRTPDHWNKSGMQPHLVIPEIQEIKATSLLKAAIHLAFGNYRGYVEERYRPKKRRKHDLDRLDAETACKLTRGIKDILSMSESERLAFVTFAALE